MQKTLSFQEKNNVAIKTIDHFGNVERAPDFSRVCLKDNEQNSDTNLWSGWLTGFLANVWWDHRCGSVASEFSSTKPSIASWYIDGNLKHQTKTRYDWHFSWVEVPKTNIIFTYKKILYIPGTLNNHFEKMDVWWFPTISYVMIWFIIQLIPNHL